VQGLIFECVAGKQGGNYPTCSNYEQVFSSLRHGHLPITSTNCMQGSLVIGGMAALCNMQFSDQTC
jgi:hypothetical protein